MLNFLSLVTAFIVTILGVYVLAKGDWRKFAVKYGGVTLAVISALIYLVWEMFSAEVPRWIYQIYGITRNIAFVLLIYGCGMDAIAKHEGRRIDDR